MPDFQWNDSSSPEVGFWIGEDGSLEIFDIPHSPAAASLVLSPLKEGDFAFFESIDSNPDLSNEEAVTKIVKRFCQEFNGKPFTGTDFSDEAIDALASVIALCRPKSPVPRKPEPNERIEVGTPPAFIWSDEPAPEVLYHLGSNFSLLIYNVPVNDRYIAVELRPLTNKDREFFGRVAGQDLDQLTRNAKLIAALVQKWGVESKVDVPTLLSYPRAIDAIDKVMARAFPKSFRPSKRQPVRPAGDSIQAK